MYKEERYLERCFNLPAHEKKPPGHNPLFQYNMFKPGGSSSQHVFKAYRLSSEVFNIPQE